MSLQTIRAFLYMQERTKWADDWSESKVVWEPTIWDFKANDSTDRIFVREITVTVDAPDDFDPTPKQVAALQAEREAITAEFTQKLRENADKLQSLLALSNEVTA